MRYTKLKQLADGVAVGDSIRVTHEGCSASGSSKNLSLTRERDGLLYYCFKCTKFKGFIPDLGHYTTPKPKVHHVPRVIPAKASTEHTEWNPVVRDWLMQSLSVAQCKDAGLAVHKKVLYVPIKTNQFLYRNFDTDWTGPKWCSVGAPQFYKAPALSTIPDVILTEDTISAIVASRTLTSYALLGTRLMPALKTALLRGGYEACYLWLDNDNSQVRTNVNKTANELRLFIQKVYIVRVEKDPKSITSLHDFNQILLDSHD